MTVRTVATIVETTNPAAVAWSLKTDPDVQVCWARGTYRLMIGFRREGRWFNTTISNPAFEVGAGTLKQAREKAREFLLAGVDEGDE